MKWVREDFLGDSVETAKKLIGAVLVHRSPDGMLLPLIFSYSALVMIPCFKREASRLLSTEEACRPAVLFLAAELLIPD